MGEFDSGVGNTGGPEIMREQMQVAGNAWDSLADVEFAGDKGAREEIGGEEGIDRMRTIEGETGADWRIETALNRVFEGQGMGLGRNLEYALGTTEDSVYRVTGEDQIEDVLRCGYVRPRKGKIKGGTSNKTYWNRGGEKLFFYDKRPVVQASYIDVKDRQIGAIPLEKLEAIYRFDERKNRYVNVIEDIRASFAKRQEDEAEL